MTTSLYILKIRGAKEVNIIIFLTQINNIIINKSTWKQQASAKADMNYFQNLTGFFAQ